jgi:signal transduction histidine kinase
MREAGLPTELHIEGEPADIAPGVDLTAYRIIQEALTNSGWRPPASCCATTPR